MGSSPTTPAPDPCCCLVCGAPDAPALFVAPVCPACARCAQVELETGVESTELWLQAGGGRFSLAHMSGPITIEQSGWWIRTQAARAERLAVIASGYAAPDDPDFIETLPGYLAEVGESAFALIMARRQAAYKLAKRARDAGLEAKLAES